MSPLTHRHVVVGTVLGGATLVSALLSLFGQDGYDAPDHANRHAQGRIDSRSVSRLKEIWAIETAAPVTHRPLVHEGRVYFGDWHGRVRAADLRSGRVIWERDVETPLKERAWSGFCGTGAIGDGLLFEASAEGRAFAIDLKSGDTRWTSTLAPGEATTGNCGVLLHHGGRVFVGLSSMEEAVGVKEKGFVPTFRGRVIALDARTGRPVWTLWLAPPDAPGVAVWGGFALDPETKTLFFATGNNYAGRSTELADAIVAVEADTGKVRWARQLQGNDVWTMVDPKGPDYDFGTGPQLFEAPGRKLVGAGQKSGLYTALERETGKVVWQTAVGYGEIGGGIMADASVGEGRVLVWSNNSFDPGKRKADEFPMSVKALDAATGAPVWSLPKPAPAGVTAAGVLSRDVYFVPSLDARLRAYRAEDGKLLWISPEDRASIGASLSVGDDVLCAGRGVPELFGGRGSSGFGVWAYAPKD